MDCHYQRQSLRLSRYGYTAADQGEQCPLALPFPLIEECRPRGPSWRTWGTVVDGGTDLHPVVPAGRVGKPAGYFTNNFQFSQTTSAILTSSLLTFRLVGRLLITSYKMLNFSVN